MMTPSAPHSKEYLELLKELLRICCFVNVYTEFITIFSVGNYNDLNKKTTSENHDIKWQSLSEEWHKLTGLMSPGEFTQLCLQILITRAVESFQYYIGEMLSRLFRERPEILRSSETVKLNEILKFRNMQDFVKWAAERKVINLSYGGLEDIVEYLTERIGVKVESSGEYFEAVKEAVEVRNIIVHNRGRVNSLFINRTGRKDLCEGNLFELSAVYVTDGIRSLEQYGGDLDTSILNHFGLSH
jgi:hypothetical protein